MYSNTDGTSISKKDLVTIINTIGVKPAPDETKEYVDNCKLNRYDEVEFDDYLLVMKKKT